MQDDREIVERVLQGDKQAFGVIIDRYRSRVFSLLRKMLCYSQDTQDIAQGVFIRAYSHLPEYNPERSFSAWLYRIAANRCLDELRKRKRTPGITGFDFEPVHKDTPETVYLQKEREIALQELISVLDKDYRTVLVMRYLQFLSYQEIGERLSIPVSTVQMRLYRARKKLRECMSDPKGTVKSRLARGRNRLCQIIVKEGRYGKEVERSWT
ncbi:RNA polymerase sigma factor [Brevibacillus borstelensis]|uniref:RNA polymerase sigma factor n=1 Tax=Brevibacillus borstelensis TaxID=45462 RepID=UPI0030C38F9A